MIVNMRNTFTITCFVLLGLSACDPDLATEIDADGFATDNDVVPVDQHALVEDDAVLRRVIDEQRTRSGADVHNLQKPSIEHTTQAVGSAYGPCDFTNHGAPSWTGCESGSTCFSPVPPTTIQYLSVCLPLNTSGDCPLTVTVDGEQAGTDYQAPFCQIPCHAGTGSRECPSRMECSAQGTCAWISPYPWAQPGVGETWGPCDMTDYDDPSWWGCTNGALGSGDACLQPLGVGDDHLTICVPQSWDLPNKDCPDNVALMGGWYPLQQDVYCAIDCEDTDDCPNGMECSAWGACAWVTELP